MTTDVLVSTAHACDKVTLRVNEDKTRYHVTYGKKGFLMTSDKQEAYSYYLSCVSLQLDEFKKLNF